MLKQLSLVSEEAPEEDRNIEKTPMMASRQILQQTEQDEETESSYSGSFSDYRSSNDDDASELNITDCYTSYYSDEGISIIH